MCPAAHIFHPIAVMLLRQSKGTTPIYMCAISHFLFKKFNVILTFDTVPAPPLYLLSLFERVPQFFVDQLSTLLSVHFMTLWTFVL